MEFIGDLERAFASAIYPNRLLVAIVGIGLLIAIGVLARHRRWDRAARRRPRRSLAAAMIAVALVGPLAWYFGSSLFLSSRIDEPAPVAAGDPTPVRSSAAPSNSSEPTAAPPGLPPSPTAPPIERTGTFVGADEFHFGEGTVRLLENAAGQFTIRLEDFAVRNGPDLYVYLSPDAAGSTDGAIELGRLKADRGNQNYDIPAGTDLSDMKSVVIWCKQFAVLFAAAELS